MIHWTWFEKLRQASYASIGLNPRRDQQTVKSYLSLHKNIQVLWANKRAARLPSTTTISDGDPMDQFHIANALREAGKNEEFQLNECTSRVKNTSIEFEDLCCQEGAAYQRVQGGSLIKIEVAWFIAEYCWISKEIKEVLMDVSKLQWWIQQHADRTYHISPLSEMARHPNHFPEIREESSLGYLEDIILRIMFSSAFQPSTFWVRGGYLWKFEQRSNGCLAQVTYVVRDTYL